MNKALGSVFCLITFCEHRSIFSRQNISISESKRLEKAIVVCRLTIAVDIMSNLFNLFLVRKKKDWVIVSIMSSDNDGNQENG